MASLKEIKENPEKFEKDVMELIEKSKHEEIKQIRDANKRAKNSKLKFEKKYLFNYFGIKRSKYKHKKFQ